MRALVVLVVLLGLAGSGWLLLPSAGFTVMVMSSRPASAAGGEVCVAGPGGAASHPDLSPAQVEVARAVWRAAHDAGVGDRGAVVGIATAMQESALGANVAATNGGRDVGPFQQRNLPGWYGPAATQAENTAWLSDPANAAAVFFAGRDENGIPGLDDIPGWESLPVTVAAQRVQRSAHPDAYARHEPVAASLVGQFAAGGGGVECVPPADAAMDCPASGLAAERGLTPDAALVLRCAKQRFPGILSFGGVRPDSMPYHPSGRAVDMMTPGVCAPVGQQAADWLQANAAAYGVDHIIWCQRIWSVGRAGEGWRVMPDRGSPTQNHMDHVHVTVFGDRATAAQSGPVLLAAGQSGATVSPIPTKVPLTARFNQRGPMWSSGFHTGLDFAAAAGTPIVAARSGVVLSAGWNSAYGWFTKIDHGGGVESWYAHQTTMMVKAGDRVQAGQQIGTVGSTGNSSGAHLHFEVRQGGAAVDPHGWLVAGGAAP